MGALGLGRAEGEEAVSFSFCFLFSHPPSFPSFFGLYRIFWEGGGGGGGEGVRKKKGGGDTK